MPYAWYHFFACGAETYACSKPGDLNSILRRAFASPKPALIQVDVDPDENPLPPEKILTGFLG